MKWRLINGDRYSEAMHHAIDQVLTEKIEKEEMKPTIRFWYRKKPSVPLGRFQSLEDEVEVDYAEKEGVEVVRRMTGGGAMFVEPGNVITYSLYLPKSQVPDSIEESYRKLDSFAVEALKDMGIEARYEPLNDIEDESGKLGGAAQLRKKNSVLHHTTISYDLDTEEMLRVLRIGEEKLSDKAVKSAEKRVSCISDHVNLSREEVMDRMIASFAEDRKVEKDSLTGSEKRRAEKLSREKFSSDEWNNSL